MSDRVQPARASRMPRDENQLAVARARVTPAQKMFDFRRLAVLIDAEKADIKVVPRILKIVRIAAKKRDCLLGREYQPNVRVLFELIQVILPALKQRDHIAAETRFIEC